MQIIKFINNCEVWVETPYSFMDEIAVIPRIFYSGEEVAIDHLEQQQKQTIVFFDDGTSAVIASDDFVLVEYENEQDFY